MAVALIEFCKSISISNLLLLLSFLFLLKEIFRVVSTPLSRVPGPWYTNWTTWVLTYRWLTGRKTIWVHELHEKYGPVVRLSPDTVDISEVSAVKEIHRVGSPFLKTKFYLSLGNISSVFNISDPKHHAYLRRLLSAPMSESSLRNVEHIVVRRVKLAVQRIGEEMQERGAADSLKWWLFMATDVIGELTFGESFKMLEHQKKNQYAKDLETIPRLDAYRTTFPTLTKFARHFPVPVFRDVAESSMRTERYANESIRRYKTMLNDSVNPVPTLFTKLFNAGGEHLSDHEINQEAQGYIVAGSDTTANTLTYLVWKVCSDTTIKEALLKELDSLTDDFKDSDLKALPYFNQIIAETLRLYGAVPSGLPRLVPTGGAMLAGYKLPGGSTVVTQAYTLHRDPHIFPDPNRFDPARWKEPTQAMKDAFMPFGRGSRTCLGMHLAYMEIRLAATLFFRTYPNATVSTAEGMSNEDMVPQIFFLLGTTGKRCLLDV